MLADRGEVNFEGKHLRVRGTKAIFKSVQRPYPPLYFGGSSAAGVEVSRLHPVDDVLMARVLDRFDPKATFFGDKSALC